jgi:two-component system nitrogen regulation response regulator NtrX
MMTSHVILIVDDESKTRILISEILADEGYITLSAEDGEEALEVVKKHKPDLVLLDLRLPDMDGIQVLGRIRKNSPNLPVILISAHGSVSSAVKAVKLGAYDFLEKPLDSDRLVVTVRNALQRIELQDEVRRLKDEVNRRDQMIGSSSVMKTLKERISQAASNDAHVFITGETGSGKDLVARAIHRASERNRGPFVKLNCAAIPRELVESELFGYCKGAFTGAHKDKQGRIEAADGGTIFFDEIGELTPQAQAKLLHFMDSKSIERLGETSVRKVDVRVIAATNRELTEEVKQKRFREDLFYRLNVIDIQVPPLRDHKEDIPGLVEFFLENVSLEFGIPKKTLDKDALGKLIEYSWPGNVRQLRNVIEKAVSMSSGLVIQAEDLPPLSSEIGTLLVCEDLTLHEARQELDRRLIQQALEAEFWNIPAAAERLGIDKTNLYRKMKTLGLKRSRRISSE